MKIMYLVHQFYPEYWSGTEKFVLKLSSMMQKAGQSVHVVTYSFHENSFFDKNVGDILYKEFIYRGIPVTAFKHKRIPENLHIALEDKSIKGIAKHLLSKENPDIIHVAHPMRVGEFITTAKLLDIPYIITLTDFSLLCPKIILVNSEGDLCAGPENGKACRRLCQEFPSNLIAGRLTLGKDILLGAQRVISPSDFLASLFKKNFNGLKISTINHGISYSMVKRSNKNYKKGDKLVFCYAGSLNPHKGVHILVQAFKRITANDVILKIFGSGPDPLYVNRLFAMAKDDERIEFCGVFPEENVGDIFSNADVVVVPSLCYESYSLVLHEALACNTPVIASNIGVLTEKIEDNISGFTFSVGDINILQDTMERIINNPELLNDLKENLKSILVPTVEQEAYAYYRLYDSISKK